jgi:hypothetical protein
MFVVASDVDVASRDDVTDDVVNVAYVIVVDANVVGGAASNGVVTNDVVIVLLARDAIDVIF